MYHVRVADSSTESSFIDAQSEIESELAATHNRIPGVASPGFHRLLMLGAHLGRVNGILLAMYIHVAHHRGQAEIYLRDNGIKPPPYRI